MNRINPNAVAVVALGVVVGAIFGAPLIGLAAGLGFVVFATLVS